MKTVTTTALRGFVLAVGKLATAMPIDDKDARMLELKEACDEILAALELEERAKTCCFMGCNKKAEFEIWDEEETRPDCAVTESCEDHVGALIGSVFPTNPIGPWRVIPILPKAL